MQIKQKWTNVLIVTPEGVTRKDLLIDGKLISDLIEPDAPTSADWKIVDGGGQILYPGTRSRIPIAQGKGDPHNW